MGRLPLLCLVLVSLSARGEELPARALLRLRPVQATRGTTALAFSPDGRLLLSGSLDGTARLWDVKSGSERLRHDWEQQYWISSVAFAPDARTAAVGGHEETRLLDLATGKVVRELKGQAGITHSLVFSADGKTLISASNAGTLRWWDATTGVRRRSELYHLDALWRLSLQPNGGLLVDGNKDRLLKRLDWEAKEEVLRADWVLGPAHAPVLSADGRMLATVEARGALQVWEFGTKLLRLELKSDQREPIRSLAFSADGRRLASGGDDGTVVVWNVNGDDVRGPVDLPGCWLKLNGVDGVQAFAAIVELAATPEKAAPYLDDCLRGKDEQARVIRKHIEELDHPRFARREKAMKELTALGEPIRTSLLLALEKPSSLEAQRRLESLLTKLPKQALLPSLTREVRAIEALERMRTKEARTVLQRLAASASEERLKREAKAALDRLPSE